MLRLARSTVVHHAIRAIPSQRLLFQRESSRCFSHNLSKKLIDRRVVKAVESEIKSKQSSRNLTMPSPPADFPFTIHENPCKRKLSMTRELCGEKIYVSVDMPKIIVDDVDGETQYRCRCGNVAHPHVLLYVKITKENGKILDFGVEVSADHMTVGFMSVIDLDHPWVFFGPYEVFDVDSDLQCALKEYLEMRGVRKCDALFLYKYMVKKSKRDPLHMLEKFNKFLKE